MTQTPLTQSKDPLTLPQSIREITLTIAAKNLDPTLLSEQFLKFSGIVPNDLELARQPTLNPAGSQLMFKNGLGIVAQPRVVNFMETLTGKEIEDVSAPQVARQFIAKLPNAEYQGVTISPKCLIPFPNDPDGARKYITQTLLAPGSWQNFGKAPVQAGINFLYQFEGCQLNLNVNQAMLQIPDQKPVAAILFTGNFNYATDHPTPAERIKIIDQYLSAWQSDVQTFQQMIEERFMGNNQQPVSVFG
ncbi:MAG: hypothetical protein ACK5CA_10880 [Cyanobacteriota bacterium]|jgi:hypothetical protein